ncbi:reverse transcriptase domain-containing protein [Tanacetum coccineum]|uniref:Reverse transcriptase domain-containing protein n=1 Tax=Tanacetum coccineum TaxID=301880 RepID=A0ABQ4WW77_9ASTR
MKKVIVELPLLTNPKKEETLYVYLAATEEALSAVLAERKGKHCPIHYVRGYEALGRFREVHRTYEPRNAIKGQVLDDFLSEALVGTLPEAFFHLPARVQSKDDVERWNLFTDGASNSKGSGAGLFSSALAAQNSGPCMALKMKVRDIDVKVDSKLVASQINGSYVASSTSMIKYLTAVRECIAGFKSLAIQNIPRNLNQKVKILSKLATHAFDHLTKEVLMEVLAE